MFQIHHPFCGPGGRPLVRYCVPAELTKWKALRQTPDGVQPETPPDGQRIETSFHRGWPDGTFKFFGLNGRLYAETSSVKGHRIGSYRRYRNDGSRFDES